MDKGGGSQTVTQESKNRPWYPQGQYLLGGFSQAANLLQQPGQQNAVGMNAATTQGLNGIISTAQDPNNPTNKAMAQFGATANGDYLNANPYLDGAIRMAQQPVMDQWRSQVAPGIDSQFSMSGRLGSGAYAQARNTSEDTLGRALGDISSGMTYQNYQNERQNQLEAARLMPQYQDANNQAMINAGNAFQQQGIAEQNHPWQLLNNYQNVVGGQSYGSSGTSTQTVPTYSNPLAGIIGGGLGLGSLLGGTSFLNTGLAGLFGS